MTIAEELQKQMDEMGITLDDLRNAQNAQHDEKGRFTKGNKGGGRKRISAQERTFYEQLKAAAPKALETLIDILNDEQAKPADKLKVACFIIEHSYGSLLKSEQNHEFETEHNPFSFDF